MVVTSNVTNSKHVTLSPDSRSMPPKNKSELVSQAEVGGQLVKSKSKT